MSEYFNQDNGVDDNLRQAEGATKDVFKMVMTDNNDTHNGKCKTLKFTNI